MENFESIKVFWSWEDPQGRVKEEIENFDALWENKTRGLRVLDFSKTSRELLKRYQQSSPPGSESLVAEDPASYGLPLVPKIPDWVNLREYQEAAIEAWRDAGGQGILAMATGTGKTLTALVLAMRVHGKNQPILLVVVCPFINLAEQRIRELTQFGIPSTRCYHSSERWRTEALRCGSAIAVKAGHNPCFGGDQPHLLEAGLSGNAPTRCLHHFLIADEAHNMGAEHAADTLPEGIKLRLGLSAMPKRHMDDEGTQRLLDFFGGVVFEFGIKEALSTPANPDQKRPSSAPTSIIRFW